MTPSLTSRTLHALSWSFIELAGLRGAQCLIGIILARLLLPEQFGLVGMLTVFTAVAQSFVDSGFGSALIQKQNVTRVDTCSVFYFNIVIGLIAACLLCLTAPLIAAFYGEPLLAPLTRLLSLNIVINSFGIVQTTLMVKHIDFKTQTKISMTATLSSGAIGVVLAYRGFGVWSLAIQQVLQNLFRTVLLWFFNAWRPSLAFSFSSLRSMFGYGSRLLASGLLNTVFDNVYLVAIGRLFSATQLGFYARAKEIEQLPALTVSGAVNRVLFPVFVTIQDDPARLKCALKRALTILALIHFPVMIGLIAVARPLVMVFLTDKWSPCIPYLQLLCIAALLYPLQVINLNLLKAKGRSDLFLRLEMFKKALIALNIAITWSWGIEAMISGQILLSVVAYYLNSYYTAGLIRYPLREQIVDLLPSLGIASVMGAAVYALNSVPFRYTTVLLISQVILGMMLYMLLCRGFRLRAFVETWESLREGLALR